MKGMRLYLIGSATVLILYLLAQYYKPAPTDWSPSYLKEDKIPYGLYILNQEKASIFPGAALKTTRLPVYNTLKDQQYKNTSYLFIAGSLKFDKLDYQELVKFMHAGNQVFIAAFDLGKVLNDTLKLETSTNLSATARPYAINFVNPALKAKDGYVFDKGLGDQYFTTVDTSRCTVLGRNNKGDINFVKYTFGKGALYILPNPQLLTNYNLLHPAGAAYASKALSYLQTPGTLLWDENSTRGNTENGSVLRVFFKHDQLRWAYCLALAGLLTFVLFEMKRRQRIIPVLLPLKNSSAEFVTVVGKVYYQQRDNSDIAQKKINYFLEYIRLTYRLKTLKTDEEFISALVLISGAQEETIRQLFTVINTIQYGSKVTDGLLIELNKLIEKFYNQAK
ncbi:DUF4350 domain-containing protein [Pedobacter cryoconitis]|uniref:DUF4350 domain-containing protein n=1 Tax=Pedobacter cryoconitis TaxID=188932 RepID=A0A327RUR8_9SPHI|nr:DUF4350 domain-containing protein [Pedobacter cryoconitis]RAJ20680.1 hypothetical protein LY11_05173 [Pedobacter cryoconitis]